MSWNVILCLWLLHILYGLFFCFLLVWNIPKNARKLGVGRGQFDVGVSGLIFKLLYLTQN